MTGTMCAWKLSVKEGVSPEVALQAHVTDRAETFRVTHGASEVWEDTEVRERLTWRLEHTASGAGQVSLIYYSASLLRNEVPVHH